MPRPRQVTTYGGQRVLAPLGPVGVAVEPRAADHLPVVPSQEHRVAGPGGGPLLGRDLPAARRRRSPPAPPCRTSRRRPATAAGAWSRVMTSTPTGGGDGGGSSPTVRTCSTCRSASTKPKCSANPSDAVSSTIDLSSGSPRVGDVRGEGSRSAVPTPRRRWSGSTRGATKPPPAVSDRSATPDPRPCPRPSRAPSADPGSPAPSSRRPWRRARPGRRPCGRAAMPRSRRRRRRRRCPCRANLSRASNRVDRERCHEQTGRRLRGLPLRRSTPDQLGDRPRLEGASRGGVRGVAVGGLRDRAQPELGQVELEAVEQPGRVATRRVGRRRRRGRSARATRCPGGRPRPARPGRPGDDLGSRDPAARGTAARSTSPGRRDRRRRSAPTSAGSVTGP